MIYEELKKIADKIVKEMKTTLQKGYSGRPAIASGKLINSINYDITLSESGEWSVVFEYLDYGRFVDKGRNPGRFPNAGAIKNWIALKGIPKEAFFPIMIKIKQGGFYSKRTATSKSGNQTIGIYSRPRGLNFTDAFTKSLDLSDLADAISLSVEEYLIKPKEEEKIFK